MLLVLVFLTVRTATAQPPSSETIASPAIWYGVAGCAAANCHGGGALPGGEYTHWFSFDKDHVRAYAVLFDAQAVRMVEALHGKTPAHQDTRCLACHAMQPTEPGQAFGPLFAADYGVGCESCHGPAGRWVGEHTQRTWKDRSAAEKASLGFRDTKDLLTRAKVCADCHVGSARGAVDHDLIAAGHPAMLFELGAYQAHQPHHWNPGKLLKDDPAYEARLWLIGQVASAQAAVEVIAARANAHAESPSPRVPVDFAEFNCHACHHDLADEAWRRGNSPSATLGLPEFGTWSLATARKLAGKSAELLGVDGAAAAQDLEQLHALFSSARLTAVDRAKLLALAAQTDQHLRAWGQALDRQPLEAARIKKLLDLVTAGPIASPSWDDAAQRYLAAAALVRSLDDLHVPRRPGDSQPLGALTSQLRFRENHATPQRQFSPPRLETVFGQLRDAYLKP